MDADGNVCSMVHTANSHPFGSGIFVQGSALPNSASISPSVVLHTLPGNVSKECTLSVFLKEVWLNTNCVLLFFNLPSGERIASDIQPMLATMKNAIGNNSRLAFSLSTIGSSLRQYSMQLIPLLLNWGVDPKAAVDGPFFLLYDLTGLERQLITDQFSRQAIEEVQRMGQPLRVATSNEVLSYQGWPVVISGLSTSLLFGAATPNGNGYAEGL